MKRVLGAGLLCACWLAAASTPAANPPRQQALAQLPDWTGLWEMGRPGGPGGPPQGAAPGAGRAGAAAGPGGPGGADGPRGAALPFNSEWAARFAEYKRQLDAVSGTEQVPDSTVLRCIWGVPRIFQGPYQFDVLVTPEVTVFSYDVGEYRRIWTDGRPHPAPLSASNMGHSIGRWEGQTLVIDTVGLRPDIWVNSNGASLSEQAHVVERWTLGADGKLSVVATVEDPVRLTRSYEVRNSYGKVTDTKRIVQQACYENVREVQEGDKIYTKFGPGT